MIYHLFLFDTYIKMSEQLSEIGHVLSRHTSGPQHSGRDSQFLIMYNYESSSNDIIIANIHVYTLLN